MRNISAALSLTVASGSSLVGQLYSHLLTYADGYAPALRFFTAPALLLGFVFATSFVTLIALTVRHKNRAGIAVTPKTTCLLLAVFIILLNVFAVMPLADPGWWLLGFLAIGAPRVMIAALTAFPITLVHDLARTTRIVLTKTEGPRTVKLPDPRFFQRMTTRLMRVG